MSSSRSIAAARNRRASDAPPTPQPQQTRPNTSINSANSLKPQQQQQQKKTPPPAPPQSNISFNKISVSDAIGLITIRLGRVEQYLIDNHNVTESHELPANTRLVDNSVLLSVVERLEKLEQYMQSRIIDLETIDLRLSDLESRNEENVEGERVVDVQDGGVDISE
jgi:hypothetical protein